MGQTYAKLLTKDYLEYLGITTVTTDGKIFKKDTEVIQYLNNSGHYIVQLYDGAKRACIPADKRTSGSGALWLPVHRIVYTWYHQICPEGLVVDHRNNVKTDNRLENLQLLTPSQNIWKERTHDVKEIKCKMNKPRSFYEDKLNKYIELYELAKINKDPKEAHKQRANIANIRAKLRYWDTHKDEYKEGPVMREMTEFKKDLAELASWKKFFKETGKKAMWHECCRVEKVLKTTENAEDKSVIVKHALDVLHRNFGGNK